MPKVDPKTKKIKDLEDEIKGLNKVLEAYEGKVSYRDGQIDQLEKRIESLDETIRGFKNSTVENLHAIVDQSMWMRNFIEQMCLPTEKLEAKKDPDFDRFNGMRGMR